MRVTFLGHAGLYVETKQGSVLCDPWFNPAYYASWFPFPSNEALDPRDFGRPTYLYLSHVHHDHFDADFLRDHVDRSAVVLLPEHPLDLLEPPLRDLGFRRFVRTRNWRTLDLDGLRVTVNSLVTPGAGAVGDSGLVLDDGEVRIFDQNDSRPVELERLTELGPYDGHFLQFSGAMWFPFAYRFPEAMQRALGRKKRANQLERALRYVRAVAADQVFPSAGPPCLLDDALFELNDFDRDPANIFPDQTVFLDHMREQGLANGHLLVPGTELELLPGACRVRHPMPEAEIAAIFAGKRDYLERYRERRRPLIERTLAALPRARTDVVAELRSWFEPLLQRADFLCAGVNGLVVLDLGDVGVAVDFRRRRVDPWQGEEWDHYFRCDRALVEDCIRKRHEDWTNPLFFSFRFQAERRGPFNEYLYNFFQSLSADRLRFAEDHYATRPPPGELWESHGYRIQRRCPHQQGDLSRFAEIEEGVLTCTLHGWRFDLATGRCLTADDRSLYARPIGAERPRPSGATVREQCAHCTYESRRGTGAR